jgi:hypothetical protein
LVQKLSLNWLILCFFAFGLTKKLLKIINFVFGRARFFEQYYYASQNFPKIARKNILALKISIKIFNILLPNGKQPFILNFLNQKNGEKSRKKLNLNLN